MGTVLISKAIKRSGAKVGDAIYVTGSLGDGATALELIKNNTITNNSNEYFFNRYYRPTPKLQEGLILRNIASELHLIFLMGY